MRRKNDRPSWLKIVLKTFAVLFFGGMWILFGIFLIVTQFEEGTDYYNSEAFYINECDEYYYERKYDELLEFMHLYDTYDDKYDVYWEVMGAYIDLQEYLKWKQVSGEDIEDARKMEELYYNKVLNACKNCRFPQNQIYLNDFAERLKQ